MDLVNKILTVWLFSYRFLGHLYSAEALVLLNKTSEAIDHLSASHLSDNFPGEGSLHLRKWLPTSLPSAKSVLQYNLATALTLRGELDKAADILKQVSFHFETGGLIT
jgi:hypothetical protein